MMRSLRNIRRLLKIARILARHDALFLLEKLDVAPMIVLAAKTISRRKAPGRPGQRLAKALQEAGPTFIKLGQMLSTRSDLLGEELCADLSQLQDDVPPFPGSKARKIIEAELECPLEEVFQAFDDEPVAAASIAQVHFAVDSEGRDVAVKVLRPDIEDAFDRDLDLMFWLAEALERARPELRRLRPVDSVRTIADTVALEMDLRFEASAAAEMAENFQGDETFGVPAVDWHRTARRVLTTERVSGIPFDDREAVMAAGHDPEQVLKYAATAFFNQVFRDGFFHGDLHPGNMFVREDGSLVAVDFGIMGRMDKRTRRYLGEMLLGFLTRDYRRAAEVHFEAGWVPSTQSVDIFTQACRSIAEPILDKPQNEISIGRLLGQLFQITETFEMETQPQLLLLQKTMLVAEGTGRNLCPDANMWFMARPLIEEWMIANLGPEARIRDAAEQAAATLQRLPALIDKLEQGAGMIADGRLRLHPETVRALRGNRGTNRVPLVAFITALAILAGLAAFLV